MGVPGLAGAIAAATAAQDCLPLLPTMCQPLVAGEGIGGDAEGVGAAEDILMGVEAWSPREAICRAGAVEAEGDGGWAGTVDSVVDGWGIAASGRTPLGRSVASLAGAGLGKLTTSVRTGRIAVASASLTGKIAWPTFRAIETSGGDLWASLVI